MESSLLLKKTIQEQIQELKERKNVVVLAHNYQPAEIQDVADRLGDSLELARVAMGTQAKIIVFCGVYFMAETAKILNPEKKVLVPDKSAICPMARMVNLTDLEVVKQENPGAAVVSYVNTTAATKAQSNVCCTSANAVRVVGALDEKKIIFVPDENLGQWVKRNVTNKEILLWQGYCYVHKKIITLEKVRKMKSLHPDAVIMAHPECNSEVLDFADEVLSTGGMVRFASKSGANEFIVATEEGLCTRLRKENPGKLFYEFPDAICGDMKKNTLEKLLRCLKEEKDEVSIEQDIMKKARAPIERMLEMS
ncbi:MAG TPA: quinolinate synthase NadA [Thermoplasmata archaeon]|nr:quinolinate synthase NadA [Thermoplasmata archaeon]